MKLAHVSAWRWVALLLATALVGPAIAQSTQLVEDQDVGVRLSIPRNWTWQNRSNGTFVNCAPDKNENGKPACYFSIAKQKVPLDQKAITDADRAKRKGDGSRTTISARDIKVAGFPAYEVVSKAGTDYPLQRSVFVLIPGSGRAFGITYLGMGEGKGDEYHRYEPAVAAALETLAPIK